MKQDSVQLITPGILFTAHVAGWKTGRTAQNRFLLMRGEI